ncbi:unnamed protein product [Kuraishia capsulata CBS 1993]|uniref:Carboxypeptidase n=1 Tax=Kuraishia capsulata CBS 1993 TaxID=1382522 RepID=W6MLH2_9ASCO|nr:uncharacterized protein KUCA_T00003309001 [Kuraishia capsulata CBS 1993]CDK27331.1 unnamed protein product [Kuraishia capsulata CBS 1993]
MKISTLLSVGSLLSGAYSWNLFDNVQKHLGFESLVGGAKLHQELRLAWEAIGENYSEEELKRVFERFEEGSSPAMQFPSNAATAMEAGKEALKGWQHITNPTFEGYQLRMQKSGPEALGIDTVAQWAGYLDVEAEDKHFFSWFFESRNDPANDPVILWLNGGPGCSSMTGLFFELGPSSIGPDLKPVFNPYAWNSNASVIFLEQPVGVGYSYSSKTVSSTAAAAKDVYVFLELFFQKFPHLTKLPFHIAGESYGGHYVPKFASEIINQASRSFELTSIMVGNGITNALIQNNYYRPMACGEGGYPQVITDAECDEMDEVAARCQVLSEACDEFESRITCVPAGLYCNKLMEPYAKTGLNVYDIRKKCGDNDLCYDELSYIESYLNEPAVMETLGVQVDKFVSCNDDVGLRFAFTGDLNKPHEQYVAELLEKGYPVLLYAGDKDFICNWLGNFAWSAALEWSGKDEFASAPLTPWYTLDSLNYAGDVKNYQNFTFARVFDAGHMVPYDQPENSLDLINRWISGDLALGTK